MRSLGEAVEAVEGGGLIAFSEGRIVENCVLEIGDFAFEQHYRLADVQQLGCVFAEDVYAKQFERFAME